MDLPTGWSEKDGVVRDEKGRIRKVLKPGETFATPLQTATTDENPDAVQAGTTVPDSPAGKPTVYDCTCEATGGQFCLVHKGVPQAPALAQPKLGAAQEEVVEATVDLNNLVASRDMLMSISKEIGSINPNLTVYPDEQVIQFKTKEKWRLQIMSVIERLERMISPEQVKKAS